MRSAPSSTLPAACTPSVRVASASVKRPSRAADRHLVRLRQVQHDVRDRPALTTRRPRPVVVGQWCQQLRQVRLLLSEGRGFVHPRGLYASATSADGPGRSRSCGRRPFGAASSAPSLGQRPPRTRATCRRPRCEPPPASRSSTVRRSWRWSRLRSAGSSEPAGRAGSRPARQSTSSTRRLPSPATRCWSISRAFSGAAL